MNSDIAENRLRYRCRRPAPPKGVFYAEYVAVPAKAVGHVPVGMSQRDAGAAAVTGLTAQQGIYDALHLKAGETVIVHGASGGVGTLAVQFASFAARGCSQSPQARMA